VTSTQENAMMTPDSEDNDQVPEYSEKAPGTTAFTIPQAGRTYKIHHPSTGTVIALVNGNVQLQKNLDTPGGGWFWTCVERNGWLGFKNHVSGTFLGLASDPKDTLHAKVTHHKAYEWFCVRHRPDGGYTLLVRYYGKDELWKVAWKDAKTLGVTKACGAIWKFEEI